MPNLPDSPSFWLFLSFGSFGAASLGSFYVTLSFRILEYYYGKNRKSFSFFEKWKRIFTHPSSCDHCKAEIRYPKLLPIFGFFISKGKCQFCNGRIRPLFPLIEFSFVCIFIFCFSLTKNPAFSLIFLFLCGHLLISCLTDAFHFSLDYENLPWILFFGITSVFLFNGKLPGLNELYVLGSFFLVFLILFFLFPGGIGFGDVLFAPVYALIAGHPWWMFFLNASYIPAVLFTIVLRERGKSLRKAPIPMGLYFGIGLIITFLSKVLFDSNLLPFTIFSEYSNSD
ncbi:prepilin peptidase [Leptospira mayottensis]|uniref:Peptidase, A24 type IV prepilin peptidase family protein n=2 Tax=Leptospira mayottensis TaxID=1137606 RepID=A0AA87MMY7_9LEPT|nr:A24 family peptidase [Leptospira mayottensis]AXR60979.1 prepilin peptidase [Leptospira mayottensis]AXR64849.1 prepilin peptidase [Leptospira mayottensis]AZQ02587.1 prepilin peptidase [Leptospira mayottensis 200901116]EKR98691.1 peptidase, A24 type IV prepilin peptidase family protein [Leptospira mayottensis 200901122]TGM96828.1 prepilin peptidase [Leptospira mayottensis]